MFRLLAFKIATTSFLILDLVALVLNFCSDDLELQSSQAHRKRSKKSTPLEAYNSLLIMLWELFLKFLKSQSAEKLKGRPSRLQKRY